MSIFEEFDNEKIQKIKVKPPIDIKILKKIVPIIFGGLALLIAVASSIYSVYADEVGAIQRFGRYVRTTYPGLHFKLPFGIERLTIVKTKKIRKEEFNFRTIRSGKKSIFDTRIGSSEDKLMLTGDLNILDLKWAVQYKVNDPVKYLFNVQDPRGNVRDISQVVVRRLIGDYTVDEGLTTKREEISFRAEQEMQKILDKYDIGLQIVTVRLLDVNPPEEVKAAFNEVNEAKQEKERMINQAWEAYNKIIPKEKGIANRTINKAEAYHIDIVNRAKGEASRFSTLVEAYRKAPDVTRTRIYLETMEKVLPKIQKKYFIITGKSGGGVLQFLNLKGDNR